MKQAYKYRKILLLLLLTGGFIFSSCTSDEGGGVIPGPPGDGYSLVQVSIKNNNQTPTYAPEMFEAYSSEKEIRNVAFFTQTDDVGKFGDPGFLPGAFNKYFSSEELRSVHGLHEPLEEVGGNYTASIRIKSEGFGPKTQVIVIANYEENGLTQTLMDVRDWEGLKYVLTPEIQGQLLQAPLLMYGVDSNVALINGGTRSLSISLFRAVARVDVVNDAFKEAEPDKGFVLHSAQLIHPKEFGFLLPGNTISKEIPTVASLPLVTAGNLPENDPTKITGLYVYETDNSGDNSEKTRIIVKGLLFDKPFEREIPFKKPDEKGKEGDPIGLNRNHRYQVTIASIEGNDIEWDVKIADWSTGQDIDVKPVLSKPVITNVEFESGGDLTRWDPLTKTYTYDGKNPEVVRFTATGLHATAYGFHCELEGKGESIGLNNPDQQNYKRLFKRGEATLTNSTVSQDYEITLPTVLEPDVYAVPVDIKLYIQNSANYYYADTITVRCRPDYLGMDGFQPVKLGGIYWAPVNVGATSLNTIGGINQSNGGYLFQWGRNEATFLLTSSGTKTGPVSWEEATDPTLGFLDTYIIGTDWLNSADKKFNYRNSRWSPQINDSPCPKGWRVPTEADCNKTGNYSWNGTALRIEAKGDNTEELIYFPNTRWRDGNGSATSYSYATGSWTSTYSTNGNPIRWVYYYSNRWAKDCSNNFNSTCALPIRCVQSITPTPSK